MVIDGVTTAAHRVLVRASLTVCACVCRCSGEAERRQHAAGVHGHRRGGRRVGQPRQHPSYAGKHHHWQLRPVSHRPAPLPPTNWRRYYVLLTFSIDHLFLMFPQGVFLMFAELHDCMLTFCPAVC